MTQEHKKKEEKRSISRREFLRTSAGLAGLAALSPVISACGSAPETPAPTEEAAALDTPIAATPPPDTPTPAPTDTPLPPAGPKVGGTLVFAAEEMGESFETGLWNGFGVVNVLDNICEGLTRASDDFVGPPQPALAESWDISEDGRTYMFKIREGVKFHDGADLNADAVVRSLTRQTNEEDPSNVPGSFWFVEYGWNNWESITAEDEYTVKLVLKEPDAVQLHKLFHPSSYIISPKALDEYGRDIGTNMTGTGPFMISRFSPGQETVLDAFEDYWDGGRPALDTVIVRGYPSEGGMLAAIESGEVNLAPYPPAAAVARLQEAEGVAVEPGPPLVTLFLANCALNPPLDNKDIRLAVNYAINRENLIQGALYGLGEMPSAFIGPLELGFDPFGRQISTQDVEKAREHIEKSGLSTPIPIELSYENSRFWPQMAELIKVDLESVGFEVTLDRLDAGSFWGKVLGGEAQLNINQRSLWVPDPDNKISLLHSETVYAQMQTGNVVFPVADELDSLIEAGRHEQDPDKRVDIYREIQAIILEWMPYVTLAYYTKPVVMSEGVKGLPVAGASTERVFLRTVWLDT